MTDPLTTEQALALSALAALDDDAQWAALADYLQETNRDPAVVWELRANQRAIRAMNRAAESLTASLVAIGPAMMAAARPMVEAFERIGRQAAAD